MPNSSSRDEYFTKHEKKATEFTKNRIRGLGQIRFENEKITYKSRHSQECLCIGDKEEKTILSVELEKVRI